MTHQLHRFATTTCKRPDSNDSTMLATHLSHGLSATSSGAVRARRRRRRSNHG